MTIGGVALKVHDNETRSNIFKNLAWITHQYDTAFLTLIRKQVSNVCDTRKN